MVQFLTVFAPDMGEECLLQETPEGGQLLVEPRQEGVAAGGGGQNQAGWRIYCIVSLLAGCPVPCSCVGLAAPVVGAVSGAPVAGPWLVVQEAVAD